MKTQAWTFVDKSAWPRGPWDSEPDKLQWTDETTGLPCLIHRAGVSGSLCGYVGVSTGHPWYEKDYDAVKVTVHGGLTFADFCQPASENGSGICHVPEPGESERVWWLVFDCAHAFDLSPRIESLRPKPKRRKLLTDDDEYRDIDYVRAECVALAAQVACGSNDAGTA
jgi:hypothetical protein